MVGINLLETAFRNVGVDGRIEKITVRLPSRYDRGANFAAEPAVFQTIATLARNCRTFILHSYAPEQGEAGIAQADYFADFHEYLPNIAATYLSSMILTTKGFPVERRAALLSYAPRVQAMDATVSSNKFSYPDYDRLIRGGKITFISFSDAAREYLSSLFGPNEKIDATGRRRRLVDVARVKRTVAGAIEKVLADSSVAERLLAELGDSVGAAVAEFFENTYDHAVTNHEDVALSTYLNGIQIKRYAFDEAAVGGIQPALNEYVNRYRSVTGVSRPQFLEVSVFDTGPGYASRFLRKPHKDISLEDEIAAASQCVREKITSKGGTGVGYGIYNALQWIAHYRGFVQIRTGRVTLEKGYVDRVPRGSPDYNAYLTGLEVRTPLNINRAAIWGTNVSFLVPFSPGTPSRMEF